jgi:hypothetical protein
VPGRQEAWAGDPPQLRGGTVSPSSLRGINMVRIRDSSYEALQNQPSRHACRVSAVASPVASVSYLLTNTRHESMNVAAGPKLAAAVTNAGAHSGGADTLRLRGTDLRLSAKVVLASLAVFARAPSSFRDPLMNLRAIWRTRTRRLASTYLFLKLGGAQGRQM